MLVLSRQRDETIMIGDDVEITVVDIRGDKVRLGISAPARVAVHRKEVYEAIRSENEQAARAAKSPDLDDLRKLGNGPVRPGVAGGIKGIRGGLPGLSVRPGNAGGAPPGAGGITGAPGIPGIPGVPLSAPQIRKKPA